MLQRETKPRKVQEPDTQVKFLGIQCSGHPGIFTPKQRIGYYLISPSTKKECLIGFLEFERQHITYLRILFCSIFQMMEKVFEQSSRPGKILHKSQDHCLSHITNDTGVFCGSKIDYIQCTLLGYQRKAMTSVAENYKLLINNSWHTIGPQQKLSIKPWTSSDIK